jgi:hypothetical protein
MIPFPVIPLSSAHSIQNLLEILSKVCVEASNRTKTFKNIKILDNPTEKP